MTTKPSLKAAGLRAFHTIKSKRNSKIEKTTNFKNANNEKA